MSAVKRISQVISLFLLISGKCQLGGIPRICRDPITIDMNLWINNR